MAEEKGSVQLGKSLLSQAQSRTRRLQKSSDKKFYGALAIGGYDAYSKAKGVKAYEELYSSFEPLINQRANELEQSTTFKATHDAYLNPKGQNAPVFGANQWEEALLYNHVMTKVRAAKVGDSSLDIDVQKEMDKVRNNPEWSKYTESYGKKLTAANSMKLTKTIDDKGEIVYSDPIVTKLQKVAKQMSKSYGIMPDLLRVLGVGTSADLATQTFKDRRGASYEILLPEADTPAKQKLQSALLAEMERGTFDEASEAEIAAGLASVQTDSLDPASTFEIDLAKLSKMPDIETSITDIRNERTEAPAFIQAATYITKDGKEYTYEEILNSFDSITRLDTKLEKDAFYTDWKRTAAQMYNVITNPEIDPLGGATTQDQFIKMAFEELLQRNKITLEAGNLGGFFGINTRYKSMSPNDQLNLIVSLVNKYTEKEKNNLSNEDQLAINERLNNAEQTLKRANQENPNNPVNLAKKINTTDPTNKNYFVFVSEEAKEKHISSAITYFNKQGFSDEDIDMYRSIMEEVGVDPTKENFEKIETPNPFDIADDETKKKFKPSELTRYDRQIEIAENFSNRLNDENWINNNKKSTIENTRKRLTQTEQEIENIINEAGTAVFINIFTPEVEKLEKQTIPILERRLKNSDLSNILRIRLEKELEEARKKLEELR